MNLPAPLPPKPEEVTVLSPICDGDRELKWPSDLPWLTFFQQTESRKIIGEKILPVRVFYHLLILRARCEFRISSLLKKRLQSRDIVQ